MRTLAIAALAFALLAGTSAASDNARPAPAPTVSASSWFDLANRYAIASGAPSAPNVTTALMFQTDTYWFDAAICFTSDPTTTAVSDAAWFDLANRYAAAGGAPSVTTALMFQTDTYWYEVAMRYADAGDPFRPQIAAER